MHTGSGRARTDLLQHPLIPHAHAACTEHQRLHDHGGQFCAALGNQRIERRDGITDRWIGKTRHLEQQRLVHLREHAAPARRHRTERVAVVRVVERRDEPTRHTAIGERLQRELDRDLDGRRAVVGEENLRQPPRQALHEPCRERRGRLVRESREDDLIETLGLLRDRIDDVVMTMTVRGHPP